MFWETSWTDKKALVGLIFHECSYSFNFFFSFCECITGQGKFSAAILLLKICTFQGKICLQDQPVVDSQEAASQFLGIFFLRRMIFVTDALGDTVFMLNTCVCIQDALSNTLQQPDQRQFFLTMSSIMNSCFISRSVVWEDQDVSS